MRFVTIFAFFIEFNYYLNSFIFWFIFLNSYNIWSHIIISTNYYIHTFHIHTFQSCLTWMIFPKKTALIFFWTMMTNLILVMVMSIFLTMNTDQSFFTSIWISYHQLIVKESTGYGWKIQILVIEVLCERWQKDDRYFSSRSGTIIYCPLWCNTANISLIQELHIGVIPWYSMVTQLNLM